MPSQVSKRVNGYGFLGFFISICSAIAYYLAHSRGDCNQFQSNFDQIQVFHVIAIIAGAVLLVLGLLNFAGQINGIVVLVLVASFGLAALGGMMIYSAYLDFISPCPSASDFIKNLFSNKEANIFNVKDSKMIGVFFLDIFTALMFFSSSGSFYRNV